jgi:hypothetical protein
MSSTELKEYIIKFQDINGIYKNVGTLLLEKESIITEAESAVSTPTDVQITKATSDHHKEQVAYGPRPKKLSKKSRLFQAEEFDLEDLIIKEPTGKGVPFGPSIIDYYTDYGIEKEIYEITKEQFGTFIYQGPNFIFKLMKVVKNQDYPSYIVITTFEHNLHCSHPAWKLYQFSSELFNQIVHPHSKHNQTKVYFRITNVHIPAIDSIYSTIKTHKGPGYTTTEIFARTGNEVDSDEEY